MTREEHVEWCKKRAREYLQIGQVQDALASIFSDLRKHEETKDHPAIQIGVQLMMIGELHDLDSARRFIEGFN